MTPLQDLERLLGAVDPDGGPERAGGDGRAGRRYELAPIDSLPLGHGSSSVWTKSRRAIAVARRHGGSAGATEGRVFANSHIRNMTTRRWPSSCNAADATRALA